MPERSLLLDLPPEIRASIYEYALTPSSTSTTPPVVRLRSPSNRRLKPSRISKDDPRSLLELCSHIRQEAIPVFYALNAVAFRSSTELQEFLTDERINPLAIASLTHIAVDEGDTSIYVAEMLLQQWLAVKSCLKLLVNHRNLRTLEFRFYACRHDRNRTVSLMAGIKCWKEIEILSRESSKTQHLPTPVAETTETDPSTYAPAPMMPPTMTTTPPATSIASNPSTSLTETRLMAPGPSITDFASRTEPEASLALQAWRFLNDQCPNLQADITNSMNDKQFSSLSVMSSSKKYSIDPEDVKTQLSCCNVLIDRRAPADSVPALGSADVAVQERLRRVGARPRKLCDMYDTPRLNNASRLCPLGFG